jgi:hypothetical protein
MEYTGRSGFQPVENKLHDAPILQHFDLKLPTVVETDASYFAISIILSQVEDSRLKPVAYHSRKMDKVEINYKIYDKEMLAIISSFTEWHHYLEGAYYTITIFLDHKNLKYFATIKVLNRRQVYWSQELAGYGLQDSLSTRQ